MDVADILDCIPQPCITDLNLIVSGIAARGSCDHYTGNDHASGSVGDWDPNG